MNIAIIGTRGVPNYYGGFEQFAAYLSEAMVAAGHRVTVYNAHHHPWQQATWEGVQLVHRYDPQSLGTAGQFIYDLQCIWHTRRQQYDVILQLGYTSSSIWGWLLPRRKSVVTTNMDGMEWKRSKYPAPVQRFLQMAERWAVRTSDHLVADSPGIQDYLRQKYGREATFIPYGAVVFTQPDVSVPEKYNLVPFQYNMLIARMEPENNIETILDGAGEQPFIVIGNTTNKFGQRMKAKYVSRSNIRFLEGIYDQQVLNNLRYFSRLYFHGHSVGGTNPSLLEAMASQALVVAHNNIFNNAVLGKEGFYFNNAAEVAHLVNTVSRAAEQHRIDACVARIQKQYTHAGIVAQYLQHFEHILAARSGAKILSISR